MPGSEFRRPAADLDLLKKLSEDTHGAYVAAANRAKYVVENYPRTPAVADSLSVLTKAYRELGLKEFADDAMRVLRTNHPEHPGVSEAGRTLGDD